MKRKTTVVSCAYRGMEVQLHAYLPSALNGGGKLSVVITGKFIPWVRALVPTKHEVDGPQKQFG